MIVLHLIDDMLANKNKPSLEMLQYGIFVPKIQMKRLIVCKVKKKVYL